MCSRNWWAGPYWSELVSVGMHHFYPRSAFEPVEENAMTARRATRSRDRVLYNISGAMCLALCCHLSDFSRLRAQAYLANMIMIYFNTCPSWDYYSAQVLVYGNDFPEVRQS